MGNIVIPIPVPKSWLQKDKRGNVARAQQTANLIFRLQVLALLLLTISSTLLGTANFANGGEMEDGRRKVYRRRYKCATRSLMFAFITSFSVGIYTLLTFSDAVPISLAFRSRKINTVVTFLLSIVLLLACVIPICLTRVDIYKYYNQAFDMTLITGCCILMVVSWIYFYITFLVLKVLVVVTDSDKTKKTGDAHNALRLEEEALLSQYS